MAQEKAGSLWGDVAWEPCSYIKEFGCGQRSQANSDLHFGNTTRLGVRKAWKMQEKVWRAI